ncbi:MAG: hypothetical protein WA814_08140 [Candidatus Baltobacteraceae bacterium]
MKKSIGVFAAAVAGTALLTACNGSSGNNNPPPGVGTNCGGPPSANQLQVLYPIPNSKHAPPALGNVYVSTKGQLPPSNSFNFFLVQANGAQTFTSVFFGISKSQIPSPHATPKYSNPVYYASSLPPSYVIGPSQSVSLLWNDGGTGCSPHMLVSSFRTSP